MKKVLLIFACLLSLAACSQQKLVFEKFEVPGLEPKPDFWRVRPDEIIDLCKNVKKGHSEVIATTPAGLPVYAVYYGDFNEPAPQTNWSAGNSSTSVGSYLGSVEHKQTILYLAGVHGSEPENVAASMNLIQMLETGRDFRGKTDPELLSLCSKYRLIIIPCANMDGRAVSPDHLRGQPYEVFRAACQGTWKDGSLVGWRGSKEWFPLPIDKVNHPGGYPNSAGYNIMHDVAPGDMRTEEAKAICRLMARWHVDFQLNGHSCEYAPSVIAPSQVNTKANIDKELEILNRANTAIMEAGLRKNVPSVDRDNLPTTINLTNVANWCSGASGLTLECSSSYDNINKPSILYTFDQLMEPCFITLKVIMECGLESPLAYRPEDTK